MGKKWLLIGLGGYVLVAAILFPLVLGIPAHLAFAGDAADYSRVAINLLTHGFFSLDGVHAYMDREPAMSFFLAGIYAVFGIERAVPFFLVQALLLFVAAALFSGQIAGRTSARVGGITLLLLLTSGSVLHTVFSAYRECLTLSLLLLFAAAFLSDGMRPAWWKTAGAGLLFGAAILTYYSLLFFPLVLVPLAFIERRSAVRVGAAVIVCYVIVASWGVRNFVELGRPQVIDGRRAVVMQYIRGEQAEQIHGTEPFMCLWAEYISRDWSGRSPSCSFNGVMHRHWPNGFNLQTDYSSIGQEGRAKILAHPFSFLWFSVFEVLELHLPFVGGGWSTAFNAYAAVTMVFLYLGCLIGMRSLLDRRFALFLLLALYNTGVFVLTDATPRYLVPCIFCYAVFAAVGYDRALSQKK